MNPIPPGNDDPLWRQMLEYLEGTLPADEVESLNARLKADAELRGVFGDLLTQQIKLRELAEEAALIEEEAAAERSPVLENVVPLPGTRSRESLTPVLPAGSLRRRAFPRVRRSSRFASGLAAAAVLTLLGVAAWFWFQPARLATIVKLNGTVTIERGNRKFAAETGTVLRKGDRVVTAASSAAGFTYLGEATEIDLDAATDLRLGLMEGSKQLRLDDGAFEAAVAKQKPGRPLQLHTHHTEALVVGTRFKLSASATATRLEVFEGAVKVLQSMEGPSLMVPAGNGVTVMPGRPVTVQKLAATRGSLLFEQWDAADGITNETYLSQFMFSGVGVTSGGSRARGYLHPPRSGVYSFQVGGDAPSELWFSATGNSSDARMVWSSTDTTAVPFSTELRNDRQYYLELRCASRGSFSLSWIPPNGQQRVIYGQYLSPFDTGAAAFTR